MAHLGEGPSARSAKTVINFPAARDEGLLVETVGDETVVYDLESKEAHCLKPLAAVVFTNADGRTSAGDIAIVAEEKLGEPITEAHVQEAIAQLEATALLETPFATNGNGFNRRQMIGRSAVAAGGAFAGASLITTILAPTAMAAGGSKIPPGCTGCGKNNDCQSNHCCQSNAGKDCNEACCVDVNNSCHFCNCVGSNCDCTVTLSTCPTCTGGSVSCCTTNPSPC